MKDALQAHFEACSKAKIPHRDISVGNILITEEGGILIDWDFSKPLDMITHERSATWQFMSAKLLLNENPPVPHLIADDCEAFYHVLCWMFWKYCRHTLTDCEVSEKLAAIYDWSWQGDQNVVTGGTQKMLVLRAQEMERRKWALGDQTPIVNLILQLEDALSVRYVSPPNVPEELLYRDLASRYPADAPVLKCQKAWKFETYVPKLESSEWFWEQFRVATLDPTKLQDPPVLRKVTNRDDSRTANLKTKTLIIPEQDKDKELPAPKKQRLAPRPKSGLRRK
ncbi:hypothetical protein E1B28_009321 [Marasmius oreades]|uniref:Fungal-type protein kinase domain-containing protein n=1 Tax=Marasmius oreades TaxID=181124 RepID=A0A9P7S0V4_9AGAR|nr:uncharacterized protein E1B28_009321 [Marasmius oreades]KAG7093025.1 hypothetical protein E1B28_009321 [Marasmius oreades]